MITLLPSPLTDFVGREDEIASLKHLITARRLVTLIGTGGVGKTRLALQVATRVETQFADGVYLLEFAPLSDPAQVLSLVASSVGVREQAGNPLLQTLIEALQPRHILLIFDNCEHVIASCTALALSLLQHCPQIHLLATSREGLRLTGEMLWPVATLSYPPLTVPLSLERLANYDAIKLFCDRAAVAEPHFRITTRNMEAIARICSCLDGLPLALELAAGRLSLLSVDQLAVRLNERFRVLTDGNRTAPARHQTLQATFDWSYTLLSEAEQKVLQRLSVFSGSWTLEAVEEICADEKIGSYEILDILTQLAHKSWIIVEGNKENGEVRYHLLETIQQYAHHHLIAEEDVQQVYVQHWEWYLHFIEEATQHLHGSEQAQWFHRVECEIGNLRLALERSLAAKQGEITARIACALGPFWVIRSQLSEGRYWYDIVLALPGLPSPLRVRLFQQTVEILRFQGEYIRIRSLLKECMALLRTFDAPTNLAESCCSLGWTAFYQGDCEEAITYCNEGLHLFREDGDQRGIARCLSGLAMVAMLQQEYLQARILLQEVISIRRALQDQAELAYALNAQTRVAVLQGDKRMACEACQEALHLVSTLKQPFGTAYSFEAIAALAALCDDMTGAVQLFSAAHALRTSIGAPLPPSLRAFHEHEVLLLRVQLGESAFEEQWVCGQTFSLEQASAEAARVIERAVSAATLNAPNTPNILAELSQREIDVLRLVATGLTDAQAAKELVLSTRTVSTHLRSIYRKLGVSSRSGATKFAVDQHLL